MQIILLLLLFLRLISFPWLSFIAPCWSVPCGGGLAVCSSAVWSVRLLRGEGFFLFFAGWGAGRCLGWGWVLLRFAVFARPAQPGVSGSCAPAAGGGCLRAGVVPALLAGHALLGPWCCAPAFGSCGGCMVGLALALAPVAWRRCSRSVPCFFWAK